MPHSKPTHRANEKLIDQEPSPPITRADLLERAHRDTRLQRQNWTSNNYNSFRSDAPIFAEWVMEDEVPAGDQRFLTFATRRAFVEDRVQIRVQIHKLALQNPKIAVYLHDAAAPSSEYAQIIGSENGDMVTLAARGINAVHRAIQAQANISTVTTVQGETNIYLEVDAANARSFIATTLTLPAIDDERVSATYHARVELVDAGKTYIAYSPTIEAVRWWARPTQNLAVVRTSATTVTPLIDGENYFHEVALLLAAAQAGDHVYIASWSFNPYTAMDGGANAVNAAIGAADMHAALAHTLAGKIGAAVANNVTVHILLDSHNAPFGEELINDLKSANFFAPHDNRIEVRASGHPKHFKVGIGKLSKTQRIGSYHEKYVCLVGSQYIALIGGIDSEADRMNPQGHTWRHESADYRALLVNHLYGAANAHFVNGLYDGEELMPWHDVGIKVVGQRAIHDLCEDFIRRWNEGTGQGANLVSVAAPAHPAGERTIHFVKTDQVKAAYGALRLGNHPGTLDVVLQAVREARHYIYMENQYMRDQELAAAIAKAMRDNTKLQVILVIPFQTEEAAMAGNRHYENRTVLWMLKEPGVKIGKIQLRASIHGDYLQHQFIQQLRAVDAARVGVYALAKYVGPAPAVTDPEQIYPHAKTMVVDDTWAYIGSANANGRSMKTDGESGYVVHDRAIVTAYRNSLWQEHLMTAPPDTRSIRTVLAHWDAHCLKGETDPATIAIPALAATSAVEVQNPPQGQRYNGPGSSVVNLHDFV